MYLMFRFSTEAIFRTEATVNIQNNNDIFYWLKHRNNIGLLLQ